MKSIYPLAAVALLSFSLFSSCEKDHVENSKIVAGEAKIKLINASQGASSIDFYLNDEKINTSALAYGEGSDYIKIPSGAKTTRVNKEADPIETVAGYNFVPTFSYTSFFIEDRDGAGEILTFEDNLGAVEAGKSRIRFINLSPNFTNTVNVSLPGGELVVSALPFKGSSSYFLVQSGTTVGISIVGTSTFRFTSGNEFEPGKNYTIWLGGSSNSTLSINKITYN